MSAAPEGADLAAAVKALARRVGYHDCGVTGADPFPEYARALEERMARFPEAAAEYAGMLKRADPRAGTPWARAIVVCARRYDRFRVPAGLAGRIGRAYLFDRRCKLCPEHGWSAAFTAGLRSLGLRARKGGAPDRAAAARAGLARLARNGFACTRSGSWANLECWLVDAALPPDPPAEGCPCPEGCDACRRACPTGALESPGTVRLDRCAAWLTYGAPLPLAPELEARLGGWIYGCDACQAACPLNRDAWEGTEPAPWLEEVAADLQPERLAAMDDDTFRRVVLPRFWYIPEPERWRRNARRALAHPPGH